MTTTVKAPSTAKFFTNMSNARRALKKYAATLNVELSTEQANLYIKQEHIEDGGRYFYSESDVTKALTVVADKVATVTISTDTAPAQVPATSAPTTSKARSVTQNGVRRPIKGLCADVWAALDALHTGEVAPTIKQVRELATEKGWNLNNATIEFYGWRKFNGLNAKK